MSVFKNRGTPKWMVYNGIPIKMNDLGVPLFLETPKCWDPYPGSPKTKNPLGKDHLKDRGFCLVLESSMLSIILSHGHICVHLAESFLQLKIQKAPGSFAKYAKNKHTG